MPTYKPVGIDSAGNLPPRARQQITDAIDERIETSAVTIADGAPGVVMHGVFAESAKPTPLADGKTHIGWMIAGS